VSTYVATRTSCLAAANTEAEAATCWSDYTASFEAAADYDYNWIFSDATHEVCSTGLSESGPPGWKFTLAITASNTAIVAASAECTGVNFIVGPFCIAHTC